MPANNHPAYKSAIEALHSRHSEHFVDRLIAFQDEAYAMGRARGQLDADPKWIPVSERLPAEDQGTVAVLFDDGQPGVGWATYWHGAKTGFACWTFPLDELGEDRTVTHWLPLPPAPEAKP